MSIPDYQTLMLPLLKRAADGGTHRFNDLVEDLAEEFALTEEGTSPLVWFTVKVRPEGPQGEAKIRAKAN
jgi:restriction endonuclease Mrr